MHQIGARLGAVPVQPLVLAGGQSEKALRSARLDGLLAVTLNMAVGGVPDAVGLVVTDPAQADVMAVMAVAGAAKFNAAGLPRCAF